MKYKVQNNSNCYSLYLTEEDAKSTNKPYEIVE